jgi:hypothetical protein
MVLLQSFPLQSIPIKPLIDKGEKMGMGSVLDFTTG